ncbi:MAG: helix-turn-helix domain-containing protein [Candidatus Kaelpia aquatica]|nr:helix-turn-helix domain-containing protein [Candidatus Kaelpia aquatica]
MDKLLTFSESAAFLKIEDDIFQGLIDEYKIPHYKIAGKFIRFSQQELEKYKDLVKENKSDRDSNRKGIAEIEKTREIEYKREDLSPAVKISEFLKFNDFYILSLIVVMVLLYYIIKF